MLYKYNIPSLTFSILSSEPPSYLLSPVMSNLPPGYVLCAERVCPTSGGCACSVVVVQTWLCRVLLRRLRPPTMHRFCAQQSYLLTTSSSVPGLACRCPYSLTVLADRARCCFVFVALVF